MLPLANRLRAGRDFRRVYARGRSYVHPTLVLYVLRTEGHQQRVGFSVSKKLGGAVRRNTVKRRLREVWRALLPVLTVGFDGVVVARGPAAGASLEELRAVAHDLAGRARLGGADRPIEEAPPCDEPGGS